ncbi:MAG TPA: hypothetical protein VLB44_11520 [Kofleriaceae bacterium]|nr:hypothetical protein [Kofleriaceae bacterium]
MGEDELTEKVEVDAFDDTAEVVISTRRLRTQPEWPPPPPAPAPLARIARIYKIAKRLPTSPQ